MNLILFYLSIFFLIPLLIYFLRKKKKLLSFTGDKHQNYLNNSKVPLVGGIIVIYTFIIHYNENLIVTLFIFLIFFLGLLSDIKFIKSPNVRMFIQLAIIFSFVYLIKLDLRETGVIFIDQILKYQILKILFLTFCILIIVNGNNFIDGLNGLSIGYFIIINLILLISLDHQLIDSNFLMIFLFSKLILLALNFNNQVFQGDNGSYLLGFFFGFYLIEIYNQNIFISPFFIILLLWYPSFELLFSIIRKFKIDSSPLHPDNNHLHHLIYFYFYKKTNKQLLSNNLSSLIINSFNFAILLIGSAKTSNTQYQIFLIVIAILFYTMTYVKLNKYKNSNN